MKHVHHEVMCQYYADKTQTVEFRSKPNKPWICVSCEGFPAEPQWCEDYEYRIQPKTEEAPKMKQERKPHKHAECIRAWAEGAVIQYYDGVSEKWWDIYEPCWSNNQSYRVKPEPEFPKTTLNIEIIRTLWASSGHIEESHLAICNEAIKHFIVVGAMDKYIEERGE